MRLIRGLWQRRPRDRFVRNIGWMGVGEVGIRLSRLIATVLLARLLTPEDYGKAAIVLMTTEFVRVFTRNGISDKLIQAADEEVEALCQTAWCLNWLIGLALFLLQFAGSFLVARFYGDGALILPIILVGCTYLIYPLAMVQTARVRRDNRLRIFSLTNLCQVVADNILTGLLAVLGLGMWAIVLPKLLVAPVWVVLMRHYERWRAAPLFSLLHWRRILGFGSRILGVELLGTFRENVDYLLLGRMVGMGSLGVYYFAFNAGLGLSISVINALAISLYSDLCALRSDAADLRRRFFENIGTIGRVIVPIVSAQCLLAPVYVPLVFGVKWVQAGALPILILICLSALSRPFANAASMLFRAVDEPQVDLRWNVFFTIVLTLAVLLGTRWGALGVAVAVALTHLLVQPIYLAIGTRHLARLSRSRSPALPP